MIRHIYYLYYLLIKYVMSLYIIIKLNNNNKIYKICNQYSKCFKKILEITKITLNF